jgi:hypothetical protein
MNDLKSKIKNIAEGVAYVITGMGIAILIYIIAIY